MLKLIILRFSMALFSLGFFTTGFGQNAGKWTQCTGEAVIQNITNEEAQVIAKRKARLDAIEKVCGVKLQAETLVRDFIMAGDFIHSISYGHVTEERKHNWATETIPSENYNEPPIIILRLIMEAKVVPINEKPDPYFKIDLKLNRKVFQSGYEVILKIKSTKDCYITVINLAANDSVYIILPNQFQEDNFLQAHQEIEFPSKLYRDSGLHIRVENLQGHLKDTELVKVVATKQKIVLTDEVDTSSGFGIISTPKIAVTKLARWLSEIPISERAEATTIYTIQAKE